MKKKYTIFATLSLLLIASMPFFAAGMSGYWYYTDLLSWILVWGITFLGLLSVFGWKGIAGAFETALRVHPNKEDAARSKTVFEAMEKMLITSGILGMLIGLITMLRYIRPETQKGDFERGFSVAILVIVYALVTALVVTIPLKARCKYFSN